MVFSSRFKRQPFNLLLFQPTLSLSPTHRALLGSYSERPMASKPALQIISNSNRRFSGSLFNVIFLAILRARSWLIPAPCSFASEKSPLHDWKPRHGRKVSLSIPSSSASMKSYLIDKIKNQESGVQALIRSQSFPSSHTKTYAILCD
jgi:hypothetical protein